MKNYLLLLTFFSGLSLSAQNFVGKAEYISKRIIPYINSQKVNKSKEEEQLDKESEIAMKKACSKRFELTFNNFEALYQEIKQLETPILDNGVFGVSVTMDDDGKKYMNLKTKVYLKEEPIFDEDFLIVDSLKNYNWKLIPESKKIGDYTCYKATTILPIPKKELEAYNKYLKEKENGKIQLFTVKEPKEIVTTAWYTSEIPISAGPMGYWGLPGLILEINSERLVLLCSKISIKLRDATKINAPTSSKKISQLEFDRLEEKSWADFCAKAVPYKN